MPDRTASIVVYCPKTACTNSHIAANQVIAMGYTDARSDRGGKEDWVGRTAARDLDDGHWRATMTRLLHIAASCPRRGVRVASDRTGVS